jgi:hypothetical protein
MLLYLSKLCFTCSAKQPETQLLHKYVILYIAKLCLFLRAEIIGLPVTALTVAVAVDWGRGHGATTPSHLGL